MSISTASSGSNRTGQHGDCASVRVLCMAISSYTYTNHACNETHLVLTSITEQSTEQSNHALLGITVALSGKKLWVAASSGLWQPACLPACTRDKGEHKAQLLAGHTATLLSRFKLSRLREATPARCHRAMLMNRFHRTGLFLTNLAGPNRPWPVPSGHRLALALGT